MLCRAQHKSPIGKRDYAILLLAVRYGMRIGDIKNLTLSNLKWDSNSIEFTQGKTGNKVSHFILKDVGWALIDYLQNSRPETQYDNIFVCHNAPYAPFAESSNLYRTVSKYLQAANISQTKERMKGFHSFRHSLASSLLEGNVPLHDIANILGHSNTNSAAIYTKIDVKQLRECALEVYQP